MTSWGAILLLVFVVLGLSRVPEKDAYRRAVMVVAVVLALVSLGQL